MDHKSQICSKHISPIEEMDQLVNGIRLLAILFPEGRSRPSIKWLRAQVRCRQIPYVKRGRKVWFIPRTVKAWFELKEVKPLRMI
jgi:hypothetical protein